MLPFANHLLATVAVAALMVSAGGAPSAAMSLPFSTSRSLTDTVGSKVVTYTGASLATMFDSTGKLTYKPNNLALRSNDFSHAAWTTTGFTVTSGISDPDGGSNAWTLTATGGNVTAFQTISGTAVNNIVSLWIKRRTGTGTVWLYAPDGSYNVVAVTGSWVRYSFKASTAASNNFGVALQTSGDAIDVYQYQLEYVTYETSPRAYNATTSAAYYGPRFDYNPATLESRGLLVEEARTNILTYSNDLNNAAFVKEGCSVSLNATGLYGSNSAWSVVESSSSSAATDFYQAGGGATAAAHVCWAFLKKGSVDYVNVFAGNGTGVQFNLNTGVVSDTRDDSSRLAGSSITDAGNGFYKCGVTVNSSNVIDYIVISASDGSDLSTTDGYGRKAYTRTSSTAFYYGGGQSEAGSFATSYIPTAGTPVTRAADSASMTGTDFSGWWNATEGTFVVTSTNFFQPYVSSGGYGRHIIEVSNGSSFSRADCRIGNPGAASNMFYYVEAGSGGPLSHTGAAINVQSKSAFALANTDFATCVDGGSVVTASSGNVPTCDRLFIGDSFAGSSTPNCWIASIDYYNTRLSDADLQTLTA